MENIKPGTKVRIYDGLTGKRLSSWVETKAVPKEFVVGSLSKRLAEEAK